MWTARPCVGSAVGGIADQIVHREHGLLIEDPSDLADFGTALEARLRDPAEAARLERNARERAGAEYLGDRHLEQYGQLLAQLQ
jgi:trehalose synthase